MKSKQASYGIGLGLGVLLVLLGFQAEPITGTLGVIFGSVFGIASIYGWTKSNLE